MALTYMPPPPIRKPFSKGDAVEVCDRELAVMSRSVVVYAGKKIVRTKCGRRWRAEDGWYVGHTAHPFPSIRHAGN